MITKINYLKSLAFPDKDIRAITFGTDASGKNNSQYAMAPNLVRVSIGDLYKNIPGFIESLSFEIDDNTVWPNSNPNGGTSGSTAFSGLLSNLANTLYPSVIDVQIGMKIIENHKTETTAGGITKYKYNFDGSPNASKINETKE